jgi:heme/copper-type cytochrome/quinol oxidase subunit 2
MQSSNALDPQSPQARAIYDLAIHSTIIFALIFVIVTDAIIYAIFRFRGRDGEPDPKLDWARCFCFDAWHHNAVAPRLWQRRLTQDEER